MWTSTNAPTGCSRVFSCQQRHFFLLLHDHIKTRQLINGKYIRFGHFTMTLDKSSALRSLLVVAWRQRMTDLQFSIKLKEILPRGCTGKLINKWIQFHYFLVHIILWFSFIASRGCLRTVRLDTECSPSVPADTQQASTWVLGTCSCHTGKVTYPIFHRFVFRNLLVSRNQPRALKISSLY